MRHDGLASGVQQTVADAFGFVPRWDDDRNVEHNINNRKAGVRRRRIRASNPSLQWGAMSERVRNVNSTDTSRSGAAEAGADPDDENRIDFGTLFPAKGDSRRPPEWFGRALLYVALARHRIHVLLALVGRHLLSGVRHHHLAVPGAGRRTAGGGAGGSWLEAWRGFRRQSGGRGRGRGCAGSRCSAICLYSR